MSGQDREERRRRREAALSDTDTERLIRREVKRFQSKFAGLNAPVEDLYAAARLGVEEAAARFDPRRGIPFGAFATHRIRGAILDTASEVLPLSRRNTYHLRQQILVHQALEPKPVRPEHLREDQAKLTMQQLREMATIAAAELLEETQETPEEQVERAQKIQIVRSAISRLSRPHRELIRAAFGIGENPGTTTEFAEKKGLSRSQVSRRRAKAIERLRFRLEALGRDRTDP